jgi:hypothetical protein
MSRATPVALLLIAAVLLFAATEGANSPSTNDSGWANSGNAHSQSDTYADGDFTQEVQYTNFGFSSVSGTVDGILIETDAYRDFESGKYHALGINPLNLGTCTEEKGATLGDSDTDTYQTFGGAADTFSCTSVTAAGVTSSSFGTSVFGRKNGGSNPAAGTYHLDHVRITIYYTPAGSSTSNPLLITQQKEVRYGSAN